MALAVVLLVGAGLMLRTLWSLQRIDLGFNPSGVLTMRISLPEASYRTAGTGRRLLFATARSRARDLPGVAAAGAARSLPLGSTIGDFGLSDRRLRAAARHQCEGRLADRQRPAISRRWASRWSAAAASPDADTSDSQLVALINEEMARRYWAGRDPIGGRLRIGMRPDRPWVTVVGIVKDVRHNGVTGVVKEKFYVPHTQWHKSVGNPIRAMTLVVRATGTPSALAPSVRERHPPARSESSGRRRADDDRGGRRGALDAAIHERAAVDVRAARPDAVGDRHLRRALVRGQPAHARDRHPRRDRRGSRSGAEDGSRPAAWRSQPPASSPVWSSRSS